jgi:predicted small metal-binding protein
MKEFLCAAVVPDCSARFEAESEDGVVSLVVRHARDEHGMEHVPHDVLDAVRSHIRDVQ